MTSKMPPKNSKSRDLNKLVSGEPDVRKRTVSTYDVSGEVDVQKRRWLVLMTSMVGTDDIRDEFDIRKTVACIDVSGKFTFARR